MKNLCMNPEIKNAFQIINKHGFAAINLSQHRIIHSAADIYSKMDKNYDFGQKSYYNEIAFHWKREWEDVGGISCFHEAATVGTIFDFEKASDVIMKVFGKKQKEHMINFICEVKNACIESHPKINNKKLRLSRVMLRQMNENCSTKHRANDWHEDRGYDNKKFKQYLTAAITLFGEPTMAKNYCPKAGELLIFNNFHRRIDLELPEELAFIHKGPRRGPKLFLFWEFLI